MNNLFQGEFVESKRTLYTPSNFAKTSLLHLQEIGMLKAQKPHISKRNNLNSYLFFIVLSGEGVLKYNNNNYKLKQGDCIFIDCQNEYSHETSENLWTLKWIHFYGNNISAIYEKYLERGGDVVFSPDDFAAFASLWQTIYNIANSDDYVRDMRINEHLYSLLTLLMTESWHPEKVVSIKAKKRNLTEIKAYLDTNYNQTITLDNLSEKFFINKFYLTRIFKEQFGVSINNYLLQLRITKAKHLLRFSDKTVESIGIDCGIGPVHYFSRIFKKVEGISPSEYRKKW